MRKALALATRASERLRVENEHVLASQRVLEEARDRYADLYDFAPLGLITLDGAGMIRELNLRAATMFALDRRAALGLPLAGFFEDRRLFVRQLARYKRQEAPVLAEGILVARGGARVPVEIVGRRMAMRDGYRVALVDISERVRLLAAERVARDASDAKDKFIAMLGHEMRMPLAPVLAAASGLHEGTLPAPDVARLGEIIERNTGLLVGLVDDLLDVTRIVQGKLSMSVAPTRVHPLLLDVVEMSAAAIHARGLRVNVELTAINDTVAGDGNRLRQVFWNLLDNAIKFSPRGGALGVKSCNRGRRVLVEVQDSGVGLAPEQLARLFEPYQQGIRASRRWASRPRVGAHHSAGNRGAARRYDRCREPRSRRRSPAGRRAAHHYSVPIGSSCPVERTSGASAADNNTPPNPAR